jgi:ferredoxin
VCPTKSIIYGIGQYVIDLDTCNDCQVCVQVCPEHVILPIPKEKTQEELKAEAKLKA